jgi:hypothetical protein
MATPSKYSSPEAKKLLTMIAKIRRNTSGDPKYHSGRKKKEYASPYLEYLDKVRRVSQRMPQIYEFDPQHVDGTRHADWTEGERVLDDLIHECQRSLEAIREAKQDIASQTNPKAPGYGRPGLP